MAQPCFDYACSVWGNCPDFSKRKLLRTQKRPARIVTGHFDYDKNNDAKQSFHKETNQILIITFLQVFQIPPFFSIILRCHTFRQAFLYALLLS